MEAPTRCVSWLQIAHAALSNPQAALEAAEHARSRSFELLLAE